MTRPAVTRNQDQQPSMKRSTYLALIALQCVVLGSVLTGVAAAAEPGDLDPSFGTGGKVTTKLGIGDPGGDVMKDLAVYPAASPHSGKLIAAGTAFFGWSTAVGLVRYNLDGSLDATFGEGGIVTTHFGLQWVFISAVTLQPDDKIVVVGGDLGDFLVARFNSDGTVDESFGDRGVVKTDFGTTEGGADIALQDDGKIVVVGTRGHEYSGDFAVARYDSVGSLDPSFGVGGKVWANSDGLPVPVESHSSDDDATAVQIDSEGRIVVAGESFRYEDWRSYWALVRFEPDGLLDLDFGTLGRVTDVAGGARDMTLQGDGKIVVAGDAVSATGWSDFGLVRYTSDGSRDPDFLDGGIALTSMSPYSDTASAIAIQSDGGIVSVGTADGGSSNPDFALARHNPDGSLDKTFGNQGTVITDFFSTSYDIALAAALLPDHRIIAGGLVGREFGLARYLGPGSISTPDTTPPETTIASGPPPTTNSDSATFEFNSNEGGSTFECRLDGGSFSVCSSPRTYTGVSEGTHTFEVAAMDSAGNTDASPASWSWTVDATSPETTITEGPPSTTNATTASFSFSASEAGSSFECQVDGMGFAACSSPSAYDGLGEGGHSFEVRSTDPAGNQDSTPASRSWTVDTTGPGAPTLSSPLDGSSTSNPKPTFDWSDVADPSGITYQLQVDNSGSEFPSAEINQSGLAPSSFTPSTALAVGTYSWRARAIDGAGNAGAWSAVFTVTITAPQGGIAGKVTNQATKKPIAGATVNCGSGGTATTASDGTYSITGVVPGSHTCTASASGYKSLSKSVTVKSGSTATVNFALRKA